MKSFWTEPRRGFLLAGVSGVSLSLAFPPVSFGWLAWLAFLPLLTALRFPGSARAETAGVRRAFALGWTMGAVYFLLLLRWIPNLPKENLTVPFLMYPAVLVIALYLGLYAAFTAAGAAWLARRGVPLGLGFPVLWTLFEAARSHGVFGFPWGAAAYSMAPFPQLIQFASWTGVWGVSFWLLLINGTVHAYLSLGWGRAKTACALLFFALVSAPNVHSRMVFAAREPRAAVRVGLLQPNVGNNKWDRAVRDSIATALVAETAALARASGRNQLDLIAWPETAIPARLPREPYYLQMVEAVVDSSGIPLLAGFPDGEPLPEGGFKFSNAAALVLPGQGFVDRYDKRRLVPFSEHMPVPWLNRYDFGQADFTPGFSPGYFDDLDVPFGVLICFESAFAPEARELARLGARYLVNITNDQWFGRSAAPRQHFEMNVFRAIENRIGIARAANTGISGVIDPYGYVRERTPIFVKTRVIAPVELRNETTFYTRHGDWILAVLGAIAVGMTGFAAARRPRG